MNLPGLADYPELEKKYKRKYLAASRSKCPKCERAKLNQTTRAEISQRQRRDKQTGRS